MNDLRGKCKEYSEKLVREDSGLELVRGYYHCPMWGEEQHWWTRDKVTGEIIDPTKDQFPSKGMGVYEEFDGWVNCEECSKSITEDEAIPAGRYIVCSDRCNRRLRGL